MSQRKYAALKRFTTENGMSHVELMIAIALVTVLSVSALPGVGRMMDRSKVMDTRHDLLNDFNFARNTAVKNYRHIVICPSSNQQTCSGNTRWRDGWIVFQDVDDNQQRSSSERVLRTGQLNNNIIVSSGLRDHFKFSPDGTASDSIGSLMLCLSDKPTMGHRLVISKAGRVHSGDYSCRS